MADLFNEPLAPDSTLNAPLTNGANDMHASYAEQAASEDGITDFITQGGAVSAIVSGAVSMWNTGAELATYIGADDHSVKTEDVLAGFMEQDSVDYYKRHQEGLDTLGFVATSLVPGMMGIKGLKAMQAGLKTAQLPVRTSLATGIKAALIPSERAAAMRTAIETAGGDMANVSKVGLFKEAFHQQALEALAFEGAVSLTMNQNPTINKEGLDYFDAVAHHATSSEAWIGVGLGGVLGGTIDSVIKYSGLKKLVTAKELASNQQYKIVDAGEGSYYAGDKVATEIERFHELNYTAKTNPEDKKAVSAGIKQRDVAIDTLAKAISNVDGDGQTNVKLANQIFKLFTKEGVKSTEAAEKLGGLQRASTIGSIETAGNVNSKSHVLFMEADELADIQAKYTYGLSRITKGQSNLYVKGDAAQLQAATDSISQTKGFAFPYDNNAVKARIKKLFGNDPELNSNLALVDELIGKSFGSVGQAIKLADKGLLNKLTTDDIAFTTMHELGHLHTNMPDQNVIKFLAQNGNKSAKNILDQLEVISRRIPQRNGNWAALDSAKAKLDAFPENLSIKERHAEIEDYMRSPHEMLADTWEEITKAVVDNDQKAINFFKQNTPDVYRMFRIGANYRGIPALTDRLLPGRRRLLNTETGELLDHGIAPTIADVGNIKANLTNKVKTVSYGRQGNTTYGQVSGDTKYNPMDMNPQEANALFYMRIKDPTPVRYEVPIDASDLPRLTRAIADLKAGKTSEVKVVDGPKNKSYTDVNQLRKDVGLIKDQLLNQMRGTLVDSKLGASYTYREIARILDVNDEVAFKGTASYFEDNIDKFNFFHSLDRDLDTPTHVALMFGKNVVTKDENGFPFLIQGMAAVNQRMTATKQIIKGHLGAYAGEELTSQLPSTVQKVGAPNFGDNITTASTTSGVTTSGNEEYLNSFISFAGKWTNRLIGKKQQEVKDVLTPYAQAVVKDTTAKAHMAALDSLLRQRFYHFLVTDKTTLSADVNEFKQTFAADLFNALTGSDGKTPIAAEVMQRAQDTLKNSKLATFVERMDDHSNVIYAKDDYSASIGKAFDALSNGDTSAATKALDEIVDNNYITSIQHPAVSKFTRTYTALNDDLVRNRRNLNQFTGRNVGGLQEGRIYPGAYNTKDLPFFKFVISKNQEAISNDKSIGIISGRTAEDLKRIESEVLATYSDEVEIVTQTKENIERYKQLEGSYDGSLAIDENSMNAELHRKGRAWNVAPVPSERTVENYMNNLLRGHSTVSREFVAAHYGEEVATLSNAAKDFEEVNRSTWGAKSSLFGEKTNIWKKVGIGNPYSDKIRQMLDINNLPEYKTWYNLQQTVADKFNTMVQEVKQSFHMLNEDMISPAEMNRVMEKYGQRPAFNEDVTDYLYANTKIPRKTLEAGVAKVNGIIGTLMLRMDGAQAMTDVLSTAITTAPEIKMLVKQLNNKALQDLLHVEVPNTGVKFPTASKVMLNATKDIFSAKGRSYMKEYEAFGLLNTTTRDIADSIDEASKVFDTKFAAENPEGYAKTLADLKDTGVKALTYFNDKGAQLSKFISLRSADQIIEAAGITDQAMRRTILNTFVNRTHGNYLASQRPALFQGWGGQLIGLFQTYQFNMIQQFARHLGEDRAAALAMMGIQAGVFGAQSLPGFNALNEMVLEKNKGTSDLYTGTNNLVGKPFGEWLMYGLGSQVTTPLTGNGISLYSRGNLNPRSPILIPTRIEDIPAIHFTTQVAGNLVSTLARITQADSTGQATQALWEGLAHNGANRPLQGLGQLLAGGRTTSKGSMIMGYNEINAGLVLAKSLGVTDLDEAIAVDAFYRYEKFTTAKNAKINNIGQEFKSALRGGGEEELPQLTTDFMQRYTEAGGRAEDFGRWMKGQYLGATQSQLTKVRDTLNSPEGNYMQGIMGAAMPEDFKLPTSVESNNVVNLNEGSQY